MPKNTSSRRATALCALAVCFAAGFGGAHGTSLLETRAAVLQARTAATDVAAQARALEHSLGNAHASIRASAFATDVDSVTQAATEVEQATTAAAWATNSHQAALSTTRIPATPVAESTLADAAVAHVLEGDVDSPQVAHDVAQQLERTRDELDQARRRVENEVRELDRARAAAKHDEQLRELDDALAHTSTQVASVTARLTQLDTNVTEPDLLERTADAVAATESAAATARHVDRNDAEQVRDRLLRLTSVNATLDHRLTELAQSHEHWVTEQNVAISASNESALAAHELAIERARKQHIEDNREQVEIFSNGWAGQPAGVRGANGRLAWDSLCELDFAPQHRLQCDAAAALTAADADYFDQTGQHLVLTDSYRSYALQARTRALKPGTAARPGTSNHGWGMAIDMDRTSALWLTDNGADYGWVHPDWAGAGGSRPEWWHLEYVATNVGPFVEPAPTGVSDLVVSVFDSDPAQPDSHTPHAQPASANVAKKS